MTLFHWVFLASVAAFPATATASQPRDIEVMVLGTWHFDNPNLDLHNARADDVLTSRRQAELEAVSRSVARFRPTKIAVERVATKPDLIDANFASFHPRQLNSQRDERVQLGYRIAHKLGLSRVYAIDEQRSGDEPSYFPFAPVAAYAEANGQGGRLQSMQDALAAQAKAIEDEQKRLSIAGLLGRVNNSKMPFSSVSSYYHALAIGDSVRQPGAVLNAMWYMRNAKIFGKLMTVTRPGDRVLVIYGAGHNYWLRHFAHETPGFSNVDPIPYLK